MAARSRQPNGASTVYQGSDGSWHGRVTVGIKDDGRPDRRHVRGRTRAAALAKVRKLEREREDGAVRKAGERWTVAAWLSYWLDNIAIPPNVSEQTHDGYRVAVNTHLIPGVGAHKLDRLEPEHLERLYARMMAKGSAAGTAHQAHRTIRTALGEATRRRHLGRNPAALARAPRLTEHEIEPYSVDDVRRLLIAAAKRPNGARWAVALALGLRQGEALGLQWTDINLDAGTLYVRRNRQRPKWQHGCGGTCGRRHGGYCPDRKPLRATTKTPKSRAGRRSIGLPEELVELLRQHEKQQAVQRKAAGQLWSEEGWVFASPTGRPLNPSTDYHEWKRLVASAGLRETRLHDARHTAATVLLLLGVTERAAMGIMGWSSSGMAKRYQHITDPIRLDVAQRVNGLIWDRSSREAGS